MNETENKKPSDSTVFIQKFVDEKNNQIQSLTLENENLINKRNSRNEALKKILEGVY